MKNRPNILFIVADQLKASALNIYNELGIETPSIEKLYREGVMFNNAITPHPLCVPARTSMMTGRYPHSTGCRLNQTLMPPKSNHLFKILKDEGYVTGLIGKNHCFVEKGDLDLFDVRCEISHRGLPAEENLGENVGNKGMEWIVDEEKINIANRTRNNMKNYRKSPRIAYASTNYPLEHYSSSLISKQSIEFLKNYKTGEYNKNSKKLRPFSLLVSFPDPHEPYETPDIYKKMFPPEQIQLPPQRYNEFSDGTAPERNRVLAEIFRHDKDEEIYIRSLISTYFGMIKFIDDSIGKILDVMDQFDLRKNTIIIFTSDHGDFMGEHGMSVKGGVFYDCLVKVPLVISWLDGGFAKGTKDESMVNTVDILPTLLNFLNIKSIPSKFENGNYENLDFLQGDLLPTVTDSKPRYAAFSEYGAGGEAFTMEKLNKMNRPFGYNTLIDTLWARESEGRRKMVRTKKWKYITDPLAEGSTLNSGSDGGPGNIDELYDLENDPWELYNIAHLGEHTEIITELRRLLLNWMINTEDNNPIKLSSRLGPTN